VQLGEILPTIAKPVPDATIEEALSVHDSGGGSLPDDVAGLKKTE